jgi:hypothetical protein
MAVIQHPISGKADPAVLQRAKGKGNARVDFPGSTVYKMVQDSTLLILFPHIATL